MRISGLVLAGALALGLSGAAIAQDEVRDYVRGLVEIFADGLDTRVGDIETPALETGETAELVFDIDPAKSYFVFGACDDDCVDVDIEIQDADGEMIDGDFEEDSAPAVLISPGASGNALHVVMMMGECEADFCIAGVGVYEFEE